MDALKQIPPVNDVLHSPELQQFGHILSQPFVSAVVDDVFSEVRRELSTSLSGPGRAVLTSRIATEVARRLRERLKPSMRRVLNASGVILHTNLGRSPLPEGAFDYLREISISYSNLEFDIEKGVRGKRDIHVGAILRELLGCEAAIVVNNNAAAVLLVLNSLGEGGEVLVSRGEEVEIGESFRIPDIMARSGAVLREVGTTNRTRVADYEHAIGDKTRLLLRVHPSNFRMVGFTERPSLGDFVELGRRCGIPTYEDLGSGRILRDALPELADEPVAADSIHAGVDVISFSADKLLGGPQAGIIAGKQLFIERIRKNPLFRALRVDKLTLAVLEYVLRLYLQGSWDAIPIWKMLRMPEAELKTRVEDFARRFQGAARPVRLQSLIGGGAAPDLDLPSWGVALDVPGHGASELEERLRRSDPPVIGRIENGVLVLDFRTLFPADENELERILAEVIRT